MKTLALLFPSLLTLAACSTGHECGPLDEPSAFVRYDTSGFRWKDSTLTIQVGYGSNAIVSQIYRWAYSDSIRILAMYNGETRHDNLEHGVQVIDDTLIELYVQERSSIEESPGASIECTPTLPLSFYADVTVYAPDGYTITVR